MTDNLAIWNTLGRTSPDQTKQFKRGGGFTGTAIKPIYTEQKMTEQFGPCGIGWGFSEPQFQIVPGANNEVMVYCWLTLWFVHEGARSMPIPGVGGDKIVTHIKANEQYKRPERWESDDEAFKKAFTDAIGNAMKHIGMSADVHMGRFDDSKYVNDLRREDAEANSNPAPTQARVTPANHPVTRTDTGPAGVPLSDADQEILVNATKSAGRMCVDPDTLREWWKGRVPNIKPNLSPDRFDDLKAWVVDTAAAMAEKEAA